MKAMQDTGKVLIVGAGPTGLMLACQLALRGIPFRIIDTNRDHTTQSRAIVIHAASMELFAQMGVADRFLELGKPVQAINFIVKGKVAEHIALFSEFGKSLTEFPFFLALEQSKTEKLLSDYLEKRGHTVDWNTELISLTQTTEQVQAVLRKDGVKEEGAAATWLVGADGAKSKVRHLLNIPFGGETYPMDLFVLDCKIDWPLKNNELSIAFSDHSFAGFFPLPEDRCRVVGFVPDEFAGKTDLRFEDVQAGFADRMQMDARLYDPSWISTYRAHHRYVSEFRKGRCFLAGDAAHVHSPVGAQGMNTGLHDAYNLAWKLALVMQGKAKETLLSSYQDERLPFARQLVRTTDRAFGFTVSRSPFVKVMRMHVAPHLLALVVKIKFIARFVFKNISQIGITYRNSAFEKASEGSFPPAAPKPGQRLPLIGFEDSAGRLVNVQHVVNTVTFHLLILLEEAKEDRAHGLTDLAGKYPDIISVRSIPLAKGSAPLFQRLGIKKEGFFLIRPDLYIAYRSSRLETDGLAIYLDSFLTR
ncbi:MAG: FAD-dependent monooxygenase [Bacteroidota bacterium]|nr:FAD-dependent monooxygenase [Bacteroidota bacterium]